MHFIFNSFWKFLLNEMSHHVFFSLSYAFHLLIINSKIQESSSEYREKEILLCTRIIGINWIPLWNTQSFMVYQKNKTKKPHKVCILMQTIISGIIIAHRDTQKILNTISWNISLLHLLKILVTLVERLKKAWQKNSWLF